MPDELLACWNGYADLACLPSLHTKEAVGAASNPACFLLLQPKLPAVSFGTSWPADGMRYGTLCVVDLKRRSFSAEMYALLCNFANLVVQGAYRRTGDLGLVLGMGCREE